MKITHNEELQILSGLINGGDLSPDSNLTMDEIINNIQPNLKQPFLKQLELSSKKNKES